MGKIIMQFVILATLMCCLSACTSDTAFAPVVEGWQQPHAVENKYKVRQGDTLYSIAWAFGLDYHALAKSNHLKLPYSVEPGEMLTMVTTPSQASIVAANKQAQAWRSPGSQTIPQQPATTESANTESANTTAAPATTESANTTAAPATTSVASNASGTYYFSPGKHKPFKQSAHAEVQSSGGQPQIQANSKPNFLRDPQNWVWPIQGRIVSGFSLAEGGNHGVDISASEGAQIKAAAAGEVVYSGDGVRGYGNMIIIKNSDNFLSAYAFNQTNFVKQGQWVKQGQSIASMGRNGAGKVMLHFEIRYNGKPIDPMHYLSELA